MNIKFDEIELEGSTFLGVGVHDCMISGIKAGVAKSNGNPNIEVEFKARNGKTARDWFPTAGNKFKLGGLALACGFTKADLLAGRFSTEMLANKAVKLVKEIVGKDPAGKDKYEQTYLPSETAPSTTSDDTIPF